MIIITNLRGVSIITQAMNVIKPTARYAATIGTPHPNSASSIVLITKNECAFECSKYIANVLGAIYRPIAPSFIFLPYVNISAAKPNATGLEY